ncbi:SMI1/KNR4 family protein [Psychroserpens luteolus]|uniref:SMI1/KNR4 family protein n=1 Tax=Psychroserpens luteolus TaxID=2855840 RepID=UPI001E62A995|nr:SMI1/KNR4 family protein [Psychroserpens luteolus]MCD2259505.1 SMI1/KNR4 family protein [Psychroserpens luteolus]
MKKLDTLEKEGHLIFPSIYKAFYLECLKVVPKTLVGTDLFHDKHELKAWALELLEEDNAEIFLTEKDVVFMMHQGYMFWYFKADGTKNPNVYFYEEMSLKPTLVTDLKTFLSEYLNEKKDN